jgi:hypothetical protein
MDRQTHGRRDRLTGEYRLINKWTDRLIDRQTHGGRDRLAGGYGNADTWTDRQTA